jgi:hypothetical protein
LKSKLRKIEATEKFEYSRGIFVRVAFNVGEAMKNAPFDAQFSSALDSLKGADQDCSHEGFEHHVWSEIAIREKQQTAWLAIPAPALAACCVFGIVVGSLFGMNKAQAYEEETSLAVEQRYVESIHPVMMSADHSGHDH